MARVKQDLITCKFCRSNKTVKKGIRIIKDNKKQMYLCKQCKKTFTPDTTAGKKTSPEIILTAVTKYCQNLTLQQTQAFIQKRYNKRIALSSIHTWIKEFNPRYIKIKSKLARKYPEIIKSFRFYHSGQIYT